MNRVRAILADATISIIHGADFSTDYSYVIPNHSFDRFVVFCVTKIQVDVCFTEYEKRLEDFYSKNNILAPHETASYSMFGSYYGIDRLEQVEEISPDVFNLLLKSIDTVKESPPSFFTINTKDFISSIETYIDVMVTLNKNLEKSKQEIKDLFASHNV